MKKLAFIIFPLFLVTACRALDPLNFLVSNKGYKIIEDVSYAESKRQKLDIYIPEKINAEKKVLVFIYGGTWNWGSKVDYKFVGEAFAKQGYIVVIPDYRLYPNVKFPDFLYDTAKAVKWVHQNIKAYGGDSKEIYLSGHSAGAYNAVMVALNPGYLRNVGSDPKIIKAVVGIAGPYDFLPFTDKTVIEVFAPAKDKAITQPINFARKDAPPMLLMHGDKDESVYLKNTNNLTAELKKKGAKVEKVIYPGLGHVDVILALSTFFKKKGPLQQDIISFIDKN